MAVQRTAALAAFVLGRTLSEGRAVRTGHADGHALAALQLGGVRRLVVVPGIGSDIVGVPLLVFVDFRQAGVELRLEGVQVHRIRVKYILIDDFLPVPALGHVDFVGVCFFGLFPATADDIGLLAVTDGVSETVVLVVQLLHPVARPSGIPLRVGEGLLALRGVGIEPGVGGLETGPFAAVQDAVVVRGRIIVAQRHAALFPAGDVPPLGVVIPGGFVHVVGNPRGQVVVAEVEQPGHILRAAHHVEQEPSGILFRSFVQVAVMVIQVEYLFHLAVHQVMERAGLQQGVADIPDASRGQPHTHVVQIVEVALQVFFREVARYAGQVVQHPLPVNVSQFAEPQQGGELFLDFEKSHVGKSQRAVGHDALELHAQALGVVAHFHQVAAPVEGCLRGLQHHLGHHPDLRYDFPGNHVVDAAIIVVLRAAAPDAEFGQGLVFKEFRREDAGGGDLCGRIVLENVIHLFTVIAFGDRLRTEGGGHRRHGACVVVHAVILGVDMLHGGERQEH